MSIPIASLTHQANMNFRRHVAILVLLVLAPFHVSADLGRLGMCYGLVGDNLPSPSDAVGLLISNGITNVRLFYPEPAVLSAFRGSGVELMIGVPNEDLPRLSTGDVKLAVNWIVFNVLAFVGPEQVRYLAVGNEVLYKDAFYSSHLMPAMYNLQRALQVLGLEGTTKLSSPHATSVLGVSYPPSAGAFDPDVLPVIRQMLKFLSDTGAPLMVNMYPFISYVNDPVNIDLGYALLQSNAAVVNDAGMAYTNLLDAELDAFAAAMEREGFPGIPVAVTETGWPTAGHAAATAEKAAAYNGRVLERARSGAGTPRRPSEAVEVYLFGLFDENLKNGAEYERHFGMFGVDGRKAYDISFT